MTSAWWLDQHPLTQPEADLFEVDAAARELARRLRAAHGGDQDGSLSNLVVSFEGRRGAGKTSFVNLLVTHLRDQQGDDAPVEVRYEPDRPGSTPLSIWAAVAYRVGEALYHRFHRRCLGSDQAVEILSPAQAAEGADAAVASVETASFKDPRLHWLEVARRLSAEVSKDQWGPCLNLFVDAPSKIPGRHLEWQDGRKALLHAAEGLVAAGTGQAGKALDKGGSAASTLIEKRLVEGPTWGVDTAEFVGELGVLLRVFHRKRPGWRAVVVLDHLSCFDDVDLQQVEEALGLLRQLEGVLVLLVLDPRAGRLLDPAMWAVSARRPREDARDAPPPGDAEQDTKDARDGFHALVDLRLPVPTPSNYELVGMTRRFIEELNLPISSSEVTSFARLLVRRGIARPRETKRALLWLWMRLHHSDAPRTLLIDRSGEPLAAARRREVLELLLDLHLFIEKRLPAASLLRTAESCFPVLAHFPVRPWNLRGWTDRQGRGLTLWDGKLDSSKRDLILLLRLLTLGKFAGAESLMSGHLSRARELWRRCREELIEEDPLWLKKLDELEARSLKAHLETRLSQVSLTRMLFIGFLISAGRRFDLAGPAEPDGGGLRPWEHWFDSDLLTMIYQHKQSSLTDRRCCLVLLNLLHPLTAEALNAPERGGDAPGGGGDGPGDDREMLGSLLEQRTALIDTLRENL